MSRFNVLLITLDQLRADCLSCAGHPVVKTPHLDRLAQEGVHLARHYSQSAPCSPGRASLYTGMYQLNHRVVANGTPLNATFDNIAKAARRAGYAPTLFGYTDQSIDPRVSTGPDDPRLQSYEGILPGFELGLHLPSTRPVDWFAWLRSLGYDVHNNADVMLSSEPLRPAEHSMAAFVTNEFLGWVKKQQRPWFAHISHLRPHPPYAAAGDFANMYANTEMPLVVSAAPQRHRLHERFLNSRAMAAPSAKEALQQIQRQYFGMISEVDAQLGRIWSAFDNQGLWANTFVLVTADHGEQLGDHGLLQKGGFFEQSYWVPGLIRDPRPGSLSGVRIERFTENIDVLPTLCDLMEIPIPAQCDGLPLTPLLVGGAPPFWRQAAHYEFDWRGSFIGQTNHTEWPWDRRLERHNLRVLRTENAAYVHFADGSFQCFDLAQDPSWRTQLVDPQRLVELAQGMLTWLAQHQDRTLTGMLVEQGGRGRWPAAH